MEKHGNPFKTAKWLTPDVPSASPIISRRFTLERLPKNAALYVTGLGFFEACVNGKKLGDEYFQPVVSDWERRDFTKITYPCTDKFTHRIYYRVFDVADLLREGENLLEIQLGGGWYVQNERNAEGDMGYGDRTKCVYSLEVGGTSIDSDGSETWRDSEIVYSNLFIGEVIDPTVAPHSGRVEVLDAPQSELCEQIGSPDRVIRQITPTLIAEVDGRKIFDAGENVSGLVKIVTREGYRGEVVLRFAENLNADMTLNFGSTGCSHVCVSGINQIMCDRFVCDGTVREFEPKFVWHAFRYFEVEGEFDSATVDVIHSDVAVTATFESDSEGLNFLFDAYIRTQLDNMHTSIPSDCPHRERLGYTGDGQVTAPAAMLMLDSREFYRKWIVDILDCQDLESGHVQHTAPFQGGGGGPGGWGCAMVLVPYYFLKQFGMDELDFVRSCYEPMKRWIGYLKAHSTDSLVTSEVEGGWCLGDWCTLDTCRIPEPFVNSYYLVKSLRYMRELAELFGETSDIAEFRALEASTLDAIKRHYYDAEHGVYFDGTQGANAYAASLGLIDADCVAEYYDNLGHFDTGFLGTDVLCELLFERGYGEVAYKLLSTEDLGGYLYMKRHGATTIWERWSGGYASHNHPMFGAPARQIFGGILGIRQCEGSFGWERVTVKPTLPEKMMRASGSILTPRGRISVSIVRDGATVKCDVSVPDGIEVVE